MKTLNQEIEKIMKEFEKVGLYDIKTFLEQSLKEVAKLTAEAGKLPEYDHKKCPLPKTCIGYQSAESDYDNQLKEWFE